LQSGETPERSGTETGSGHVVAEEAWALHACEACGGRVLRGAAEWAAHVNGRRHRKRVAAARKRQRREDPGGSGDGSRALSTVEPV
jgi:tRNA dimethylallyltransferase